MYIEIIKVFEIIGIIADIKRIYATYPTFGFVVKPKALIMRVQSNKKGESI
jgi:hypothetical protein